MDQSISYSLKIGGQAGQGVKSAGLVFSKIAVRSGYNIFNYVEYPSLIKGGHNVIQTIFSEDVVNSPVQSVNFLIALDLATIKIHQPELVNQAGIVYEEEANYDLGDLSTKTRLFPIPLKKIAKESGAPEIASNYVAMGATVSLLGAEFALLKDLIAEDLAGKDISLIEANQKAAETGFNYAEEKFAFGFEHILQKRDVVSPKMVINGNEAIAFAAISAGLQFASIYPMSPVSNVMHVLAANQRKYGYIFKQAEDEISAINMSIGASFAGARSMTSTSGGGFCLMTEGYGLAGMTETPLVIIEGMRAGPATGMPTWSEQGDLRFILHSHQGEFPRIVLAAGDPKEAFYLTQEAFNLADKYQTPVVVITDKNICDSEQSYEDFDYSNYRIDRGQTTTVIDSEYKRYQITQSGVSPRSFPGFGNHFIGNSDEHTEFGYDTETISDRNAQMEKRLKKLDLCAKEDMAAPEIFGPADADITLVSWGSTKGGVLEALKRHPNVNYVHVKWLSPFPVGPLKEILERAKYLIAVEASSTSQLAGLIREKTGVDILDKLLKNDGRPFFPEEISDRITSVLTSK